VRMNDKRSGVPLLCDLVLDLFEREPHLLDSEGVFRLSGNGLELDYYIDLFNAGKPMQLTNVNLAASLLKRYLINLPEPLISEDLYNKLSEALSPPKDPVPLSAMREPEEALVNRLKAALNGISKMNVKNLLAYVMYVCGLVLDHTDKNKMQEEALAIVFAPCLTRHEPEIKNGIPNIDKEKAVVMALINHRVSLFQDRINSYKYARRKAHETFRRTKTQRIISLQKMVCRSQSSSFVGSETETSTETGTDSATDEVSDIV